MHISTKCSVAIHCLIFIHEYGGATKVTSQLLSLSTGVNAVTIRVILSALKKGGLVSARPGAGGTVLACSPEEISLLRVCAAIEPDFARRLIGVHAAPSKHCPVGRNIRRVLDCSYGKIQSDLCASLSEVTLADVLADYHALPPG